MFGIYTDERYGYVVAADLYTQRRVLYSVTDQSIRFVYVHYLVEAGTSRYAYGDVGFRYSERYAFSGAGKRTERDHRVCVTPAPLPGISQRFATFVPGIQVLVHSIETHSSITLNSEIQAFCCQAKISQRLVFVPVRGHTERYVFTLPIHEIKAHTPEVQTSITTYGEVSIFYETAQISQRYVFTPTYGISERECVTAPTQGAVLHTPEVRTQINEYYNERFALIGHAPSSSERLVYFEMCKWDERLITTRYTVGSDRYATLFIARTWNMHTFIVTPSRLEATERACFFTPFAYLSERYGFCETRPLYFVKTPLSSTPKISVRHVFDEKAMIKYTVDREVEYYGFKGEIEFLRGIASSRLTIHSKENEIIASAVDYLGAAVSDGTNIRKDLLFEATLALKVARVAGYSDRYATYKAAYISERTVHTAILVPCLVIFTGVRK